jgi:D-serine deaminase-like pyridoxal phosphate-dependent protein
MQLDDLNTPAALLNATQMQRNIARMQSRMDALGVALRPHVKTSKSLPIVQAQIAAGARGITVSRSKRRSSFLKRASKIFCMPWAWCPANSRRRPACCAKAAI